MAQRCLLSSLHMFLVARWGGEVRCGTTQVLSLSHWHPRGTGPCSWGRPCNVWPHRISAGCGPHSQVTTSICSGSMMAPLCFCHWAKSTLPFTHKLPTHTHTHKMVHNTQHYTHVHTYAVHCVLYTQMHKGYSPNQTYLILYLIVSNHNTFL